MNGRRDPSSALPFRHLPRAGTKCPRHLEGRNEVAARDRSRGRTPPRVACSRGQPPPRLHTGWRRCHRVWWSPSTSIPSRSGASFSASSAMSASTATAAASPAIGLYAGDAPVVLCLREVCGEPRGCAPSLSAEGVDRRLAREGWSDGDQVIPCKRPLLSQKGSKELHCDSCAKPDTSVQLLAIHRVSVQSISLSESAPPVRWRSVRDSSRCRHMPWRSAAGSPITPSTASHA